MNRWHSLLWPGVAAAIALGILLSLGAWQLERRAEKADILSALERGVSSTPVQLEAATLARLQVRPSGQSDGVAELTRVQATGIYEPGRSVPVRATLPAGKGAIAGGIGFFWMTPLRLGDGAVVFVNRGFVPSGADFRPPPIATPDGPQTVTGLIRLPERLRFFMAADDPAKGEYFARDPTLMAKAVGLAPAEVAPFFIDAERRSTDGATPPVGVDAREMIARIPNNHLQYAVTWFGLALTLVGVFLAFARARLKGET